MSAFAFVLAVLLAGCGRKTLPMAPQLVLPETIETLATTNEAEGILLTWKRPERYTGGRRMRDLAGFRVERSTGTAPFETLATLPVTDRDRFRQIQNFSYLDQAVTSGETYRYRLYAFTLDDYVSAPSNQTTVIRQDLPVEQNAP